MGAQHAPRWRATTQLNSADHRTQEEHRRTCALGRLCGRAHKEKREQLNRARKKVLSIAQQGPVSDERAINDSYRSTILTWCPAAERPTPEMSIVWDMLKLGRRARVHTHTHTNTHTHTRTYTMSRARVAGAGEAGWCLTRVLKLCAHGGGLPR